MQGYCGSNKTIPLGNGTSRSHRSKPEEGANDEIDGVAVTSDAKNEGRLRKPEQKVPKRRHRMRQLAAAERDAKLRQQKR